MKKFLRTLWALGACGSAALAAHAQQAPKIAVVDMAKCYDNYYKTADQMTKMKADEASAQSQYDTMTKDGQALVEQYRALDEKVKSPITSPDEKTKAQADEQKLGEQIQAKMNDRNQFSATVQREFQQRMQNFHDMMMKEIGDRATAIAKNHGANLLLDKSGIGVTGAPTVVYSDPSFDITDEVVADLNQGRPKTSAAPAAPASTPDTGTNPISVPGITTPAK